MIASSGYLSEWTSEAAFGSLSLSTKAILGLRDTQVNKFEIKSFQDYLEKVQYVIVLLLKSHSKHFFAQDSEMTNLEQQAKSFFIDNKPFKQAFTYRPLRKLLKLISNLMQMTSHQYFKSMPEELQENFILLRVSFFKLCASDFPPTFRRNFLAAVNLIKELPNDDKTYGQAPLALGESRIIKELVANSDIPMICMNLMYFSYFLGKEEIKFSSEIFKKIQDQMSEWLLTADRQILLEKEFESRLIPSKKTKFLLYEFGNEPIKDFFTIFNFGQMYAESNINNIMAFSSLGIVLRILVNYSTQENIEISDQLVDCCLQYTQRLFSQSEKMVEFLTKSPADAKTTTIMMNFIEGSLSYSLQLIDTLCEQFPDLLTQTINLLMKLYHRVIKKQSGFAYLDLLILLLKNNSTLLINIEEILSDFLENVLRRSLWNSGLCLKTLQFVQDYQELLDVHTNFFLNYGPIICKTVAYYPRSFVVFLEEILPRFVKKEIIYEFTEGLLDIPLMIRSVMFIDSMIAKYKLSEEEIFREDVRDIVLFYLVRNKFQIEMEKILKNKYVIMEQLYNSIPYSLKEQIIGEHLVRVLNKYLNLSGESNNLDVLDSLLKLILVRYERLFMREELKQLIKNVLLRHVEKILFQRPELIFTNFNFINQTISLYDSPENKELVLLLIWLIGEGPIVGNPAEGFNDLIKAYFTTLDRLVVELIAKFEEIHSKFRPHETYFCRLLTVVISSLVKIALKFKGLIPKLREILDRLYTKINVFPQSIINELNLSRELLKDISTASFILLYDSADKQAQSTK